MKKITNTALIIAALSMFSVSCNKKECHECHYEKDGAEVELGEKCDSDLETLEADGIDVNGVNYEVHCHEH
ncbi:MAG: hypothetical protein ABF264_05575 [Flavobacteriales bacterium]|jgi:hypothetical protein